ncbi:hypothetical protein AAVH_23748 [Aphelenchoides avenae]|nr:hypothetical protein AAVH_23748 [Aphelenchus avenae]
MELDDAFFVLKNGETVAVHDHPWSFDDSEFYLRVTDIYEQRRLKAEAEAGSEAVGYDDEDDGAGTDESIGDLDGFIDYTPDEEIPVVETPNSTALEEAEKLIKEERRERHKRKLREEIEDKIRAEIEEEKKEPGSKARRRNVFVSKA